MKRKAVIDILKKAAKQRGLTFTEGELSRHSIIRVGNTTKTLGRHVEVDEVTVKKFLDQFADEFGGKGWWR